MVKQKRKGRVKDKWREKKWVTALAPESFNSVPVAEFPISDDNDAKSRVVETTLFDILKSDPTQYQYKLYFQVNKVQGETAYTIFKGYEYAKEYLRSLIRRGSTLVSFIEDYKTSDGYTFRVKVLILTQRRINNSRKHALRLIAKSTLHKNIPNMTLEQFVQATSYGKIAADILAQAKKIIHVRHVGLEKVKLVKTAEAETVMLKA